MEALIGDALGEQRSANGSRGPTGGNPLFITEMIAMANEGVVPNVPEKLPIPEKLRTC